MPIKIASLDHLVLTVTDLNATIEFYEMALGMQAEEFTPSGAPSRWALKYGTQKINLHVAGREFEPKAKAPTPGSADLCFRTATSLDDCIAHLGASNVEIELGPVERTGATGPLRSIYLRDPDGNLIEISNQI